MKSNAVKWTAITIVIGSSFWLAYLSIAKGPAELMALAAVFSAIAALISAVKVKDKSVTRLICGSPARPLRGDGCLARCLVAEEFLLRRRILH